MIKKLILAIMFLMVASSTCFGIGYSCLDKSSDPIVDYTGTYGTRATCVGAGYTWSYSPGTSVEHDVPSTGDAAADEVVLGSDTRLTDDRDPNAHASTHGNGGADEVSITESQISDFGTYQDDLDVPSQAEAEAGTSTVERVWTAERVAQAIASLGGSGSDDIVYQSDCSTITDAFCVDTDDQKLYYWDGLAVIEVGTGAGGVTDHGALTGLGDNDHPQYLLTTGDGSSLTNLTKAQVGLALVDNIKHAYGQSIDPPATADSSINYVAGNSLWLRTNGDVFICTDDTIGAAVWEQLVTLDYVCNGATPTTCDGTCDNIVECETTYGGSWDQELSFAIGVDNSGFSGNLPNDATGDTLDELMAIIDQLSLGGSETDPIVGAINGLVKADGAGTIAQAVAGTDYLTPTGDGSGLTGISDTFSPTATNNQAGNPSVYQTGSCSNSQYWDNDPTTGCEANGGTWTAWARAGLPVDTGVFSIIDFGAYSSLTDDQTSFIQAAIDAAEIGGGTVGVPDGQYNFSQLVIESDGVNIQCSPGAKLVHTAASGNAIEFEPAAPTTTREYDVGIDTCLIESSSDGNTATAVYLNSVVSGRFDKMTLKNFAGGVYLGDTLNTFFDQIQMYSGANYTTSDDTFFWRFGGADGFISDKPVATYISNFQGRWENDVTWANSGGIKYGFDFITGDGFWLNNIHTNVTWGAAMYVHPGAGVPFYALQVDTFYLDGEVDSAATQKLLHIEPHATANCNLIKFENGFIRGGNYPANDYGAYVTGCTNVSFDNVDITSSDIYGLYVTGGDSFKFNNGMVSDNGSGAYISGVTGMQFSNNFVGTDTGTQTVGLELDSSLIGAMAVGNVFGAHNTTNVIDNTGSNSLVTNNIQTLPESLSRASSGEIFYDDFGTYSGWTDASSGSPNIGITNGRLVMSSPTGSDLSRIYRGFTSETGIYVTVTVQSYVADSTESYGDLRIYLSNGSAPNYLTDSYELSIFSQGTTAAPANSRARELAGGTPTVLDDFGYTDAINTDIDMAWLVNDIGQFAIYKDGTAVNGAITDTTVQPFNHIVLSGVQFNETLTTGTDSSQFDDVAVMKSHVITVNNLSTGWYAECAGKTATESAGTASINMGGVMFPQSTLRVYNSSDVLQAEIIKTNDIWGGDVWTID